MKKTLLLAAAALILLAGQALAGMEWKATITSTAKGKETVTKINGWAQGGNVREEFVEAAKGQNALAKKGMYWIYLGQSGKVQIVDPKEKSYYEMSLDSVLAMAGALGQVMQLTISNAKVKVNSLAAEKVLEYECKHLSVESAYDMEMKMLFIKAKSHIDETREMWGTSALPLNEMAASYRFKSFKLGIKELDEMLKSQIKAYQSLGFVLKSVATQNTTDEKGKVQTTVTSMEVTEMAVKAVSTDLFKVPEGYKKQELLPKKN
jgi:hypothetical protein